MANEFVGSALVASWTTASGTTSLQTDFRNVVFTPSLELVDATAGADTYRQSLPSFAGAGFSFSGIFPSTGTTLMAQLKEGMIGTIVYHPAGSAVSTPKVTIPAISLGAVYNQPYNDIVEVSCSFTVYNGAVTYGTN
jgi:hypothetical protein